MKILLNIISRVNYGTVQRLNLTVHRQKFKSKRRIKQLVIIFLDHLIVQRPDRKFFFLQKLFIE